MDTFLSWNELTTPPAADEVFGPWPTAFLILCTVGLVAGLLLYSRPQLLRSRRVLRASSTRAWGSIFLWIFSLGFFFFLVRWLQINPFSLGEPIWLVLDTVAAIVAIILMIMQIRFESADLTQEIAVSQAAIAQGTHNRRPPRRKRNRKR